MCARWRFACIGTTRPLRQRLGVLDLSNGAYQASHVALFSSYLLPAAPVCARVDTADDLRDFPDCYEQLELIGDRNMPWYLNEVMEQEPVPELLPSD
jgi:hypothetical protein